MIAMVIPCAPTGAAPERPDADPLHAGQRGRAGRGHGQFLLLLALGAPAVSASALGYGLGIVAHWLLSSRLVFHRDLAPAGAARRRQQALFLATALFGLALTTFVVGGLARIGLDPRGAKLVAIVLSFAASWLLRRRLVFR
jgi:putative flippase GtrA